MKKLLYTVLTDGHDQLKEIPQKTEGWDYIAFVDNPDLKSDSWDVRMIPGGIWDLEFAPMPDVKKLSRLLKLCPGYSENTDKYDIKVYIDASYQPTSLNLDDFINSKVEGIWMTEHPQRGCAYQEAEAAKIKQADDAEVIDVQVESYRAEGFPDNNGLYRGGVIIRIGDTSYFDKAWWLEVARGSYRDQISAPYAAWRTGTKIHSIPHGQVEKFFKPRLHSPRSVSKEITTLLEKKDYKNSWIKYGDIDDETAAKMIAAYPYCHAIFRADPTDFLKPQAPENVPVLIQGWVYGYIPFLHSLTKYLRVYKATYAVYNG